MFSSCSVSCGGGRREQTRRCVNGSPGEDGCEGRDTRVTECNNQVSVIVRSLARRKSKMNLLKQACPSWNEWEDWSLCSEVCNGGLRLRSRTCNGGVVGQIGCDGPETEEQFCNGNVCDE